ncbi:fish-egg lectin-like [Denticeps clupeoides]|uniref:Fish-egg lectin-like n=1 Tax=Denticeps clupeoides TaxID=299321 RepID=A0A8C4FMG0_9TELE|nr:fish-egg lectin-like [Denticeps clupeoides]XP_028836802.1 fish-egg lectin-like [Denticeps clupeoides]
MEMGFIVLCAMGLFSLSLALNCNTVPGELQQVDAGSGQVFGVNNDNKIYTLYGDQWTQLPGALKHVTVGPSGVWGTNANNEIFKLVGGTWLKVSGLLKQVDAGGNGILGGVNMFDGIFCLGKDPNLAFNKPTSSPAPWQNLPGSLKYYSCGPYSCWGVNSNNNIYIMKGVTSAECRGSMSWEQIPGALVMVEVGTDGSVFGVNAGGDLYQRTGVSSDKPAGTDWALISMCNKLKHVSYDQGHIWAITLQNSILDCVV